MRSICQVFRRYFSFWSFSLGLLVIHSFEKANAQIYPLRSIDSIQWVHPDTLLTGKTLSRYVGDTVRVRGLVILNPRDHALSANWKATYLVDTMGLADGVWKGLVVRLPNLSDSSAVGFFSNFQVGNIVECTGVVAEYQDASPNSGETQLNLIGVASSVLGFATPPAPRPSFLNLFMVYDPNNPAVPQQIQKPTGEGYEGMYVQFNNVLVTNVSTFSGGRVSWMLRDASGSEINVRDAVRFFRPPFVSSTASVPPNPGAPVFVQQGKVFSHMRGVITETNFGTLYPRYEIIPLTPSDLGAVMASPPFISRWKATPAVPRTSNPVTIGARIVDLDGSVASAKLFYAPGVNGGVYDSLPMALVAPDSFQATIPGSVFTQNGAYYHYYIRATDNQNNNGVQPDTIQSFGLFRVMNGGINRVSEIQETPVVGGRSIFADVVLDSMQLRGRIMSTLDPSDYGRIIFQDGVGPWTGITLRPDNNGSTDIDTRLRGDSIWIKKALVVEDFGITTLEVLDYAYIAPGQPYQAFRVPIDSVIARRYNYTEPHESSLLIFDSVYVVNQNPDAPSNFGEFSIYPDSAQASGLRVRGGVTLSSLDLGQNFNTDSLTFRQRLNFIRGILTYNFGNWKLQPRSRNDVPRFNFLVEINTTGPVHLCLGESYNLWVSFNSNWHYQWTKDGINIPGATSSSYSATTPGTYSVFVTNSSGATGLSPGVVVTVSPLPAPVISSVGSTNLCMGGRVRLNATLVNGVSYQWTRNGVDMPGMVLGTLEAIQSGNYAVKVTRGACQSVSNIIHVSVSPTCQGISLGMVQTCQNDTIEVPIYQNGLQAISAMNLRFSYNPNHLVYLGHTAPVSPLSTMGVNQVMVNSQQAWVNLNWVDLTPQNLAAGDILKIRFRAISNADLEWDTLISPAEVWDVNLNPLPLVYTSTSVVVYNSPSLQFIQRTICEGQSVNIAGQTFNTSGTFTLGTVPSTSFSTCDSNFQLQLLVIPRINDLGSVSICQGQTYTFRGRVLNTTGIYYDTLINFLGCDSLIKLNLTVNPTYDQIQRRVICQGSCFYFGGQNRCSSGTFNYTYLSLNGCDSIVTLHLTVSDSLVLQSNSGSSGICPGGQISLGSQQSWPTGGIPIWFQNGIQLSGINDSILNVQAAGAYQLRIYIPSGNCSLYSNVFSVVQLNCNKVSGNLRYDNSLNTALAGVPIHLKTLLGNIIASDTSDSSGYYELTGYQNGNYVLDASINYLPGGVNSTDALFVQRHFTSLITLSTLRRSAGDVNGSSVTNGTDALLIQRWSTGVISVMPAGTFTTDRPTLNAIGSPLVMNMKALSYGDVNGSYNIPTSAPALVLDTVYGNGNVGTAVVRFTNPGAGVFERGVVWSTSPNPTVSSSKSVAGSGGFGFTHTFPLTNTTTVQYARAYAVTTAGVYYSNEKSFTSVLGNRCPGTPSVTDIDGNVYNTVLIGNQCWTQSNLKTSKYRNGDNIPTGLGNADWQNTTSGAYAIYNNEPVNDVVYGKLYNHYAVTDSRGLCPTGWHVPTDLEWTTLENHMGGSSISGGEMKSTAVQPTPGGWNLPNTGATNSSGFTALPGGLRDFYGGFLNLSYSGGWWSSSIGLGVEAWYRSLNTNFSFIGRFNGFRTGGFSVRCCRD